MENLKCSVCGCEITHIKEDAEDYDDVESDVHFDISRTKKYLYIDDDEIVEDAEKSNEKMRRTLCEDCFVKILNESKTLGNLFFSSKDNTFIY